MTKVRESMLVDMRRDGDECEDECVRAWWCVLAAAFIAAIDECCQRATVVCGLTPI